MLQLLDFVGVAVFAATGALAASRKDLDFVAFGFFAAVTGLGGGTLRDVLLQVPVFWIARPDYVLVCLAVATLAWFTAHRFASRYTVLLWADAIGLSGYAVMGAGKALQAGAPAVPAILMGVMTATFGGLIRDVVAGEPSILLRKEVYATAALVGAGLYVGLIALAVPVWLAALSGALAAFAIRAGALRYGWTLPVYRSRRE